MATNRNKNVKIVRRVTDDITTSISPAALLSKSKLLMKKEQQQLLLQLTFPFKLYEMIEHAHDSGFTSALSWLSDGNGFFIHDKNVMMNDLAPMFFKQTKFRSFTRQLNIWGFERIGPKRDGWKHKKFIRGRPDLLEHIERTEVKTVMLTSLGNVSSRTSRNAIEAKSSKCSKSKMENDADGGSVSSFRTRTHSPDLLSYEEGSSAHLDNIKNNVQRFSCSEEATRVTNTKQGKEAAEVAGAETEAMRRSAATAAGTSTSNNVCHGTYRSLPLGAHESMYLVNIFDKHERERPSHVDVLCSILALDRETTFKTLCSPFEVGLTR